jgi:RNA polymerase sigma-70 factor (ECF subfamily)
MSGPACEVAALFREHGGLVERALRRAGVAERDLPDARQEVFIVVLRKLGGFEHRCRLSTWLYAIAVHVASDYRRKAYRRHERLGPERQQGCDPDALDALEQRERLEHVLRRVDALPPAQREVFVLHELFELSMAEVAARLRCPLKTAFSRLYAARRQLQAELRACGAHAPFWSVLLPFGRRLELSLRAQPTAIAPFSLSHALGALAAACLLLEAAPRSDAPEDRGTSGGALSASADLPASAPLPPARVEARAEPRLAAAAPSGRPRPLRARMPRGAAPAIVRGPAAAHADLTDDGLQIVRMSAVEVTPGMEHPWAELDAQPRRAPKLRLQGPHDPAGEIERALVELP